MANIAFIGLGNMGLPMARNLVAAGHTVTGFDLLPANRDALAASGGAVADTARGAVRSGDAVADVVISMLPAGRHVRAVYLGDGAGDGGGLFDILPAATLVIDCSTIDVDSARAVAATAAERGLAMMDAPVSGGTSGAAAGTLTFMVGGDEAALERARPFLSAMGRTIIHTGGPGTGQAAKICNNMVLGISMIAVSEAFALADKLGLDRQKLFDVASTSSGQCWALTSYCPVPGPVPNSPANRDYQPGFAADMMLKDLKLAQAAAASAGAATPLGAQAAALYALFAAAGMGGRDFSAIFQLISGQNHK